MPIEKFTVARDDDIYHAWPDLVLTRGGKLICSFTECVHHGDRTNSRIMLTESLDCGRTWSPKKPASETSQADFFFNNSRLSRLSDDSLVLLCDRVEHVPGKHNYGLRTVQYMWRADPEGMFWSEPKILPFQGIVPDKLHELKCGRWLLAAQLKNDNTDKLEQYLWYSDDRGKTWSTRVTVASDPRYNLCEVSILELPNGTLVAFMRENSGQGIDCLKALSYDRGESWEGVYNVPIPACHRPVSGILQDGTIMITHRFMQGGKGWLGAWTQNFFAAFMNIESVVAKERKSQSVRIMPLDYDRSPVSDLGYSGWVQFDNGEIYVVNYIVDDAPKAQIRGYSFYISDVILN